jgi:hypothetical protein
MTEMSARLGFPFLQANQAQKELYHNEALQTLDALLHPSVEAVGMDTPPASPEDGQCWIVGDAATGAWAGRAGNIACRSAGGWRFTEPRPGMAAWSVADGVWAYRIDDRWEIGAFPAVNLMIDGVRVVGARGAAIADPAGGSMVDVQARAAILSLLAALRAHGLIAP